MHGAGFGSGETSEELAPDMTAWDRQAILAEGLSKAQVGMTETA